MHRPKAKPCLLDRVLFIFTGSRSIHLDWCTHSWSCPFLSLLTKIGGTYPICHLHLRRLSFRQCQFIQSYNIAGLTATWYKFPFTLDDNHLFRITPDILLQPIPIAVLISLQISPRCIGTSLIMVTCGTGQT